MARANDITQQDMTPEASLAAVRHCLQLSREIAAGNASAMSEARMVLRDLAVSGFASSNGRPQPSPTPEDPATADPTRDSGPRRGRRRTGSLR